MKKSALKKLNSYSPDSSSSKLVKIGEASQLIGVSIDTLRRWEKKGWLKAVKTPGGTRLYDKEQLIKLNPNLKRGPKTMISPLLNPQVSIPGQTQTNFIPNQFEAIPSSSNISLASDRPILKISNGIKQHQIESDIESSFSQSDFKAKDLIFSSLKDWALVRALKKNIQLALVLLLLALPLLLLSNYIKSNQNIAESLNPGSNLLSQNQIINTQNLVKKLADIFSPTVSRQLFGKYPPGSPPGNLSQKLKNNLNPAQLRDLGYLNGGKFSGTTGRVLAESTPSSSFLQINLDTVINGIASISGALTAPTINTGFGDNEVYPMDQALLTTSNVNFASVTAGALSGGNLTLTAGSNQIKLANTTISTQTGGSGAFTVSIPSIGANDVFVLENATQTLTNKTISGSSNTFTNIPTSALSSSKITINTGSGLTGGGDVSLGGSITISATGSTSAVNSITGTANQVIASSSTGDITLSLPQDIALTSSPTFAGLELDGSTSGSVTLNAAATTTDYTFTLPSDGGTSGYVLSTDGNGTTSWISAGGGGSISGSGTANTLSKFTGATAIGDSLLTDNGTTFAINTNKFTVDEATGNTTIAGTLDVTGAVTGSTFNGLTITNSTGTLTVENSKTFTASNSLTFTGTDGTTFAFPSSSGTVCTTATCYASGSTLFNTAADSGTGSIIGGDTLTINGTAGQGISTSLSGDTFTITVANALADGSTKGVAAFNSTNFSASSGVINTIQNINTSATPTFAGLTVSGLAVNSAVYTDGSSGLTTTAPTSGTIGYWQRVGTTIKPATSTDDFAFGSSDQLTISNAGLLTTSSNAAINGGTISTSASTANLFNTNAATLNIGGGSTTALNIGNGNSAYTAINLGSGTGGNTINIAGTGATGADTINIGTGGTGADTIRIGNNSSSTAINFTSGTGAQTFTSSVGTGNTTSSAFVFNASSLSSGTAIYATSTSTSGKLIDLNASNTSGTIFNLGYGTAKVLSGDLTGFFVDLDSGQVDATNQNLTGVNFKIPTVTDTHTSGTKTLTGALINFGSGAGINQNGAGGTLEFVGADLYLPALTQTAGTLNSYGTRVTTPATITTGGTAAGYYVNATGVGAGNLSGLSVSSITAGAGNEYALNIGSGWDAALRVGSTTVINGSGVTQVAGGGTGLSSYTAGDLIYATGATTLAKLAGGAGNNGKVLTVSGGLPIWSTISGSSCTDCVINDPTSVLTQTITPSTDIQSLVVRQTTAVAPTSDIFQITSSDGLTKYFWVDKDGNVSNAGTSSQTLTLTPLTDTTALTLVGTNVTTQPLQYINANNQEGNIFQMNYGAAQTLTNALTAFDIDLSTNVTATNQSVIGTHITLPGVTNTNTSGTVNLTGFSVDGGSINQNGVGGTTVFTAFDATVPAITQTAGSLIAYGINVNTPSSITTAGSAYGLNINAAGVGAGNLTGVNIGSITGGAGTENGLTIGSGWDTNLLFNDTTTNVAVANGGSIIIKDSSGNSLCTITDAGTTGNLDCTGTIGGTGSVGFWSRDSINGRVYPSTLSDNVGIGTTAPSQLFAVGTGSTSNFTVTSAGNTTTNGTLTFGSTGITTDITLQNSETIDNDTDNQINLGLGSSGTLKLTSSTTATIANSAGALAINATATGLNLQADGSVDVNIAGGSSATGCTVTNSNGNLTCTGNITGASTGTIGYWQRNGTSVAPATITDNVGIGTTAPSQIFQVNTSGTSSFVVTSGGNAGIGTTAPAGKFDITDTSNTAASLSLTNNTATTIGNGGNTLGVIDLQSTSLTTGNFMNLEVNALTTGKGINLTNTTTLTSGTLFNLSTASTALTGSTTTGSLISSSYTGTAGSGFVGNLNYFDYSPSSAPSTSPTGDLMRLHLGANATNFTGNFFNLVDDTASIFSVSKAAFTTSLPSNFTAAGDVAIAYDINFTNPTASFIKSAAPLNIYAGEIFNSSNLNLGTYNQGTIVFDTANTTTTALDFTNNTLTTGTGFNMALGALTTGTGFSISTANNTHTTGTLLNIASSSTAQTSTSLLNVAQTGATTGITGSTVSFSTSATTNSSAKLLNLTADAMTTGTVVNLSANALTTGTGLSLASSSTGITSAGLISATLSGNPAASWTGSLAKFEITGNDADIDGSALKVGVTTSSTAGSASTALNVTSAGPSGALVARFNDDGTYTDTSPFAIDDAGNVGIGTTVAASKLVVTTNTGTLPTPIATNMVHLIAADSTATRIGLDSFANQSQIDFRRANNTSASPQALAADDLIGQVAGFGYGSTAYGSGQRAAMSMYSSQTWTDSNQGTYLSFRTTPNNSTTIAERLRIGPDGNVGIGTTAPGAPLEVKGTGTGATIAKFTDTNTTGCTLATGGTISCSSDRNLKKNIGDIGYGLNDLMKLRPVEYNWKTESDGTIRSLGFIAQEVETVIPKLVTTDSDTGYKQLNTIGIVPLLAKSIQEVNYKVENALLTINSNGQANANLNVNKITVASDVLVGGLVSASNFALDASVLNRTGSLASVSVNSGKVTVADAVNALNNQQSTLNSKVLGLEANSASQSAQLSQVEQLSNRAIEQSQSLDEKVASTSGKLASLSDRINELLASISGTTPESTSSATNDEPSSMNDLTPPSQLIATDSATFQEVDITEKLSTVNLSALDATVSATFKSLGQTFLGQTTVAGDFSVDGTMSFTGDSINSIACPASPLGTRGTLDTCGTLLIQNNPLAQAVDFFNGKVTLSKSGQIEAESLALGDEALGAGIIPAGQTEIIIPSTLVNSTSKIFITPTSSLSGVLFSDKIISGQNFKVKVSTPNQTDIKFNWMIVQTKQAQN